MKRHRFDSVWDAIERAPDTVKSLKLRAEIAHGIAGNTICALGDAAAWPMLGFLTKFRADFEAAIRKAAA